MRLSADSSIPIVASLNKTGVPRIVVPGGIGDIYWVMVKLEAFCRKNGIEGKPRITILANEVWESSQMRGVPFVEMTPFVTMGDPRTTPMDPVKPRPKALQDVYTRCGSRHEQTVWPGFMGYEYFICYNGVINSGHWLEEDDLECNWYLPLDISDGQRQFQRECSARYGRYAVFYFSIIGDFIARNLTQFPLDKMADGIRNFTDRSGLTPVFIGAWWDLRWPIPGTPPYLSQLISQIPRAVNLVGQTTLDQAFGVMRGAELVAGYHCGLTNMAIMFKRPTVLLWAPDRFPPATPLAVAPPETRNTTYRPLFTQGLTADRFARTMEEVVNA